MSTIEERNEAASKANDAETQTVFQPSRFLRRSASGRTCPACGVRMHHQDVVALRGDEELIFLHVQCAVAIAERAETDLTSGHDANGDGEM